MLALGSPLGAGGFSFQRFFTKRGGSTITKAKTYSVIEAAVALRPIGVQSKTIYDLLRDGIIKATRKANRWQIPRSEIERLLAEWVPEERRGRPPGK